ncbi:MULTISPECIES: malate dehydrogenase (quinone) [Dermabacter]|uniref:Probable malate:quinone oxidoreductase n=1 Tax=Dermabacter jinjuensis TaxID=1667168 RepID=A0ABM6PPF3_9MICO|nr:malate dehydrogenase (quinone) [Dermabacter jinjuensis]ATH96779.1 malate dehydrogenase (quinone) [Dermabacter jinjuensis]UEB90888.1 malate dehydrogenase (quinone) [Dermabacter jinjuensis]
MSHFATVSRDRAPLTVERADAVLVGAGIASATLAMLLSELEPSWTIVVLERLNGAALESSHAWNNAGTGHSALCELNYTPADAHGRIAIEKAVAINEKFQLSRSWWAHLVDAGYLEAPHEFIRTVPHMSLVLGHENRRFLKARHEALAAHPLFASLDYTENPATLAEWAPLVMEGRSTRETLTATRSLAGTDVDFGQLTRSLLAAAESVHTRVHYDADVVDLRRMGREWGVMARTSSGTHVVRAPFVFVGAGGAALPLLQRSGIDEIRGYGGFPISGQWLRCTNPELAARHEAKVYGKAAVGAPPMSVPHLDTRIINGTRELMFGPYAGWSPKFLKSGSVTDLFRSVRPSNALPMASVAPGNLDLLAYLTSQLTQSFEDRLSALREYLPLAEAQDWELLTAGQRVQVIAPKSRTRGTLQFGTELITSADGTMSGLLGASPGASTATSIMLGLLTRAFPEHSSAWAPRLRAMFPEGESPSDNLYRTSRILGLTQPPR